MNEAVKVLDGGFAMHNLTQLAYPTIAALGALASLGLSMLALHVCEATRVLIVARRLKRG